MCSVLCPGWEAECYNKDTALLVLKLIGVIMQGTQLYHMIVPRMQQQISDTNSGKIIFKAHSKKHQATRSPALHLPILPSSESFLVCRYKSDQKKPHTAAAPFGNSWTQEPQNFEKGITI